MAHSSERQRVIDAARDMLARAIGMDPDSVGPALLERVVTDRLKESGCGAWEEYLDRLKGRAEELEQIVERVIVPETWFFRDMAPFTLLGETARRKKDGCFLALSAPCSTGEEPYSMAMALLDAGLPPDRFRIDAMDISRTSLDKARRGVFGKNSFRGSLPFKAGKYFTETPEGLVVHERIREQVRFLRTNLVQPGALTGSEVYDALFCRNFLIYLQPEAKAAVVDLLWRLLRPDGLLVVGHAESLPLLYDRFLPVARPRAFAFLRPRPGEAPAADRGRSTTTRPKAAPKPPPKELRRATPARPAAAHPPASTPRPAAPPATPAEAEAPPGAKDCPDLETARRLADEGRLDQARSLCEQRLEQAGPEAEAYHLLGLVAAAEQRRAEAEAFFKKALYLDPCREETLIHLALLAERAGDGVQAEALRGRLMRLKERAAPGSGR